MPREFIYHPGYESSGDQLFFCSYPNHRLDNPKRAVWAVEIGTRSFLTCDRHLTSALAVVPSMQPAKVWKSPLGYWRTT